MLNESVINVLKNSMWDLATCAKGALVITPSKVIVTTPGAETLMISYKLKNKPFIIGSFLPFVLYHTLFLKKIPIKHIGYYQSIGLFSTINIVIHRFYPISLLNMRLLIGITI